MKNQYLIFYFLLNSAFLFGQNIWEPVNFSNSLTVYEINAEKEGFLFVSASNGILYRSQDEGLTWESFDTETFYTMRYSPYGDLFAGSSNGIYISYNNGETFEQLLITTEGTLDKLSFSPDSSIYALGWPNIIRSNDYGLTWDTLFTASNVQYFTDIDFGLNGEIYVVGGTWMPFGNGFFRSLDNGETWESTGPEGDHLQSVRVNDSGVIIIGGFSVDRILQSNDLGVTWTTIADVCGDVIESYSEQKLIAGRYINQYSGCWLSEDWGNSWVNLVDNVLNPHVRQISITPSNTIFVLSEKISSYTHQVYKSINPILSLKENKVIDEIELFPNPVLEKISMKTVPYFEIEEYVIYNQNGLEILTGKVNDNTIGLHNLKNGLYIIELKSENKIIRKKIIKK